MNARLHQSAARLDRIEQALDEARRKRTMPPAGWNEAVERHESRRFEAMESEIAERELEDQPGE